MTKHYDKYGYVEVALSKSGKTKFYKVHRLVALAFIPNPHGYDQINHKDEKRDNNHVDNLEWCDGKYNCNYGSHRSNLSRATKGVPRPFLSGKNNPFWSVRKCRSSNPNAKKVLQFSKDDEYIKSYDCLLDAAESVGVTVAAISNCCNGKRKTSAGYKWQFANENSKM